jgi:hypothetical protein
MKGGGGGKKIATYAPVVDCNPRRVRMIGGDQK